jgi:hypothetical protein
MAGHQWTSGFGKAVYGCVPVFGLAPGSVCCALIPFSIMSDGGRIRSPLTTLPDARSRSAGIGFMKMGESLSSSQLSGRSDWQFQSLT